MKEKEMSNELSQLKGSYFTVVLFNLVINNEDTSSQHLTQFQYSIILDITVVFCEMA